MPFALPAAATAVAAAAPAAAAKATLMATLKSVAFKAITNLAISAAMSALQPQVGGQGGRTFEWTIDPDAPIPFAAGRVGVAGSVVHRDTFGPDLMYYGIPAVLSGAGPITGYDSVQADDFTVTFDATGKAITSQYAGELWFKSTLGNQPDVALSSPTGLKNGAALHGWTSQHKLSGKAAYMVVMGENSKGSAFPTGEIKPLITFRGLKGWDPRQDSTYPGGSGTCRLDNPATWVYLTNPILWALKWSLGLWEGPTGKGAPQVDHQVGGIGAKLSGIDVPAFVAAANIADANGWTVSGYPNTDDDKHQVLEAFLQAGGAIYSQRAGKISCIQRAAPRTSIVTISAADTAGPLEIDTAASRIDRINTIRPRFWSPAHRWQMTAMDEVTAASYQAEDGGKRTRGIDYPFVSNAKQAGQLAALQIANTREGIAGVIPLKPHLQRIRPGDAFTITEPGFVLNGLKCLCLNTDYDPATGVVRVSFVSETDAKYPFALGQDPTPPEPQVLTPVDPGYVTPPLPGDWTIVPRPPAEDGTQIPGFDLSGLVSNETATAVIVEWGPASDGPWTQAYSGPPDVTNIPIVGLQSAQTYYIAVRYQRNQNFSDRYVYGPFVAPTLSAGIPPEVIEGIVSDVLGQVEAGLDDIDGSEELAEVVLETILNEQQGLEQEASQRIEDIQREAAQRAADLMAEAQARGENIAEVREEVSAVADDLSAEVQTRTSQIAATNQSVALAEQSAKTYADGRYALVQQNFTTIAAFNSGQASTLQSAKSYTDALKAEAALTYATTAALGSGLAATLTESQSYTNGQVSTALSTVYTKAETDAGLASTLQAARSYTDDYESEASLTFSTKTERANGDAAAVLQANAYTDDFKTEASLTYATQASLGSGLAATLNEAKSYSDGQLATAMNTVYTKAQTDSGLSSTLQQATAYSDSQAQQATLTFATKTERANGDAATLQSANSYTDALRSEANLTFATQSSLGGVSATAALALSTAQDAASDLNEARVRLIAAASGGNPALIELYSGTGGGSNVIISAAQIGFGGNTVFEDATDTLRTVTGSVCRIDAWGAPFGPDNLVYWEGPTGIATASVTKAQAENNGGQWRDSTGASYFGGKTLAGPFDSGAGSTVTVPSTAYVDVAVAPAFRTISVSQILTYLTGTVRMQAPADPESGASAAWRVVHTDTSGGDVVVMRSGSFLAAATGSIVSQSVESLITQANANWWASVAAGRSGERVVRFQLARSGPTIFLDIQTPRVRGFYAT